MIDLEKIKAVKNNIPVMKAMSDKETFWRQFTETTASILHIYFVGIYFVDDSKENVVFVAGNGITGEKLLKHNHKVKIVEKSPNMFQVGAAAFHREVKLVDWLGDKIFSYKVIDDNAYETKTENISDEFFRSPLLAESHTELYLPIQSHNKTIGVMELDFSDKATFTLEEIGKLQSLADELATII